VTLHIGWLSTGRDPAARNLLKTVYDDLENNNIPAQIDWIFCHRETGDGPFNEEYKQRELFFDLAAELGILVATHSHVKFLPELRKRGLAESASAAEASPALLGWRDKYGLEVMKTIAVLPPVGVVVMAGYMLIIGKPELQMNLVNIHPALPWGPRGTWQECIHELIRDDASEHGIMVHLVTEVLDRGPVVSFCRFPIKGPDWDMLWNSWRQEISDSTDQLIRENHPLFKRIRYVGEIRELPLLRHAIRELASGNIVIKDKAIYSGGNQLVNGVDLTEKIENAIS
jgi:phosphoribosylglycinamide formyltransferase 1